MNTPKISIIVPVYNVEKYLRRCLDSIVDQTFTDFELLLVDDGSTDQSGKICDEYNEKDARIKVFHKENGGVSTARNLGLDNAIGEYVSFVDSDDWVEPNYCQTLVDNIGDADIMFFDEIWHYEDGCSPIVSSGSFCSHERNEIEKKILQMISNEHNHNYFGYTWNKIFKREIIDSNDIRFVDGLSVSEDEIFTLDYCLNANSMKTLSPSPIYNYMWASMGLTHKRKGCDMMLLLAKCTKQRVSYMQNTELRRFFHKRIVMHCIKAAGESSSASQFLRSCKYIAKYKTRDVSLRAIAKPFIKMIIVKMIRDK